MCIKQIGLKAHMGLVHMTTLRILFLKEGNKWAAQCLEHDIAAQGDSIAKAADAIMRAFCSELAVCEELGKSIDSIPKAPTYYWNKFESEAAPLGEGVSKFPRSAKIPKPELRVA